MDGKRLCIAVRADGTPCKATVQRDSEYCFFHDPAKSLARKDAQTLGGLNTAPKWLVVAKEAGYEIADVVGIIQEVIDNLRAMPQEPQTANSMLAAVRILLDIYELKTLGLRADQLEEMLRGMQASGLVSNRHG